MIKVTPTHTGIIYVDTDKQLEFLSVGDYGKEDNIKANFLGLNQEINGVANTSVDLKDKWVATISTQKGCPMKCKFCDVPRYWNVHVLEFARILKELVQVCGLNAKTVHPVVSTMLPKGNVNLESFLLVWCDIKNNLYDGEAGLQLSINSTDDNQRNELFAGRSLSLDEISELARKLPEPKGRKYTLNFPVTNETILDAKRLSQLFDKERFIVKITPIHETKSAIDNGFEVSGYADYNVYRKFEKPLLDEGWDVIVFVPSKEEDEDRITCGNALISEQQV